MMDVNFNTYIDNIETDFWRELCIREGEPGITRKERSLSAQGVWGVISVMSSRER